MKLLYVHTILLYSCIIYSTISELSLSRPAGTIRIALVTDINPHIISYVNGYATTCAGSTNEDALTRRFELNWRREM